MNKHDNGSNPRGGIHRRTLLMTTAAGIAALAMPAVLTRQARAAAGAPDLSSVKGAKIDWQQAKGSSITIGVTPAGYFDNLGALLPQFQELTGINVRLEKTPPG